MIELAIELVKACSPTKWTPNIPFSHKPFGVQMNVKFMPLLKNKVPYFRKSFIAIENRQGDIDQEIPFNLVLIQDV